MRRILMLFSLCVALVSGLKAQQIVSGTVVDGKDIPIPGVRVEIVGQPETTMTDIDGKFKIELSEPAKKVIFHYVGFKPVERKITPDMYVKIGHGWSGKSSGYRGFWDINGGFGTGGVMNVYGGNNSVTEIGKSSIAFGWSTTHGYQINHKFFAGIGFGANALMLYSHDGDYYSDANHKFYGFTIPLYADFRWDYDITAKTAPFVDLKLGYQQVLAIDDDYDDYYYGNSLEVNPESTGSILIMPTIGLRASIGSKRAINIGLSYNISIKRKYTVSSSSGFQLPNGENVGGYSSRVISSSGGVAMLNFGFDF